MSDPDTKSIKVNISKFIKKYQLQAPKFIAKKPKSYINQQKVFNERAYLEILEECNKMFTVK
jgi:hypothetical protein